MREQLCRGIFMCLILVGIGAGVCSADTDVQRLAIGPETGGDDPVFRVSRERLDGLTIDFELPVVYQREIEAGGKSYQALAIPGGEWQGGVGEPALPQITRLIAVPNGRSVTVRVAASERRTMSGYRIWPHQPDDAEGFVIDETGYLESSRRSVPAVTVGEPALIRDLRVVPVTFRPVSYDPDRGEIQIAQQMTVTVEFAGSDLRNPAPPLPSRIPDSFHNIYQQMVLNYKASGAEIGPGTYLVIYNGNSSVLADMGPLLDWRRKLGYNVQVVTTGTTGTTDTAIQSYIQGVYNSADPPLEFVVMVGDATGTYSVATSGETITGYQGEGDHRYTMLAGGDVLPDVHIGRLSFQSLSDLQLIVAKIVDYETHPWLTDDPEWFTRASLTGDPGASGESCIHVNQWVKHQLLQLNYTEIDTVWNSPFADQMYADLNKGGTIATFRGYYGVAGFSNGYIDALTNGQKRPFAVFITCDTGSFESNNEAMSEAWLRASGGGIASIGMATIGTETRPNNCIFQGILDHVLNSGDHRVGPALSRGKLEMFNNYSSSGIAWKIEVWSYWNNLMGDPATEIWTAYPKDMTVGYDASLPVGANALTVNVEGTGGVPVEDAKVSLYKAGEILVTGMTDNLGRVNLPLATHTAGTLYVTVTKHNFVPHQGGMTLGSATKFVTFESAILDDDGAGSSSGNGDGMLNPGETIEMALQVSNIGTGTAFGVSGNLSLTDPYLTFSDGNESFGDILAGQSVWSGGNYVFSVAADAPDGYELALELICTDGSEFWTSLVTLTVQSAACDAEDFTWAGGPALDPGESGTLSIELRNVGSVASTGATAVLATESPWITVTDADGAYGAIGIGGTGENTGDPFAISIVGDCFPGHLATFTIDLTYASGAQEMVIFQANVGIAASDDPVGPDLYGYYAFDNTDIDYAEVPTYSWVEIDPDFGGSGSEVSLSDYGFEQDDTEQVALPFTFTYYGQDYDVVSICSNGWIAMGASYLKHWYNKSIPSAGSPDAMIAGFWDNLYNPGGTSGVYTWYDTASNTFVIEYSRMRNHAGSSTETFEIILYDPAYHTTDTGDGMILFQYNTVVNNDVEGNATVGIQNETRTDGIQYTYYGRYANGGATLSAGRAIMFMPISSEPPGYLEGDVSNKTGGGTPVDNATVRILESGRTIVSQANGHYYGSSPAGVYTIAIEHDSFAPDTAYAVTINEGLTTQQDFDLVDILGPYITNVTNYQSTSDVVGPYDIEMNITDYSGVSEMHFYYTSSTSGGPFELTLQLIDPGTGLYRASIPGQASGSQIQYWVTAADVADNASVSPVGAPYTVYAFMVTETVVTFFDDDFESNQGWTVGDSGDGASTGIWERGDPNEVVYSSFVIQPEDDATPSPGVQCYITGNDPGDTGGGGDDVDGGKTTLLSPWFDMTTYSNVSVSYMRWFTNNRGSSPNEDPWVVQVTDGSAWADLENTVTSDASWTQHGFLLTDYIDLTATVRFRFVATDEPSGSLVEAGVDDFVLTGYDRSLPDTEAPAVSLIGPDGGESIQGGTGHTYTIRWDVTDDIGVVNCLILFSTDSGVSWPDTVAVGAYNEEYVWDVPDLNLATCRVKVVCTDASLKEGEDASAADFTITTMTGLDDALPQRLTLGRNKPNPFNPRTEIAFSLPTSQKITLRVYDVNGRLVRTLAEGLQEAGPHVAVWEGNDERGGRVASGLYFYKLTTPDESFTRKMLLLK